MIRLGFHRNGNCWRLFSLPRRTPYFSGKVIWYSWWRLFLTIDKTY